MKVLVVVPQSRTIPVILEAFECLDPAGHDLTWAWMRGGDVALHHRYDNITRKFQRAQQLFLQGPWDAMLTLEDDQLIPPDALARLDALDAPVAYGLTVWRNAPHHWTLQARMVSETDITPGNTVDEIRRAWWGQQVEVEGCGMYCTLFRREALAAIPFERRGEHCCDFYFCLDAVAQGLQQRGDAGLLIGHWTPGAMLWPTAEGFEVRPHDHH